MAFFPSAPVEDEMYCAIQTVLSSGCPKSKSDTALFRMIKSSCDKLEPGLVSGQFLQWLFSVCSGVLIELVTKRDLPDGPRATQSSVDDITCTLHLLYSCNPNGFEHLFLKMINSLCHLSNPVSIAKHLEAVKGPLLGVYEFFADIDHEAAGLFLCKGVVELVAVQSCLFGPQRWFQLFSHIWGNLPSADVVQTCWRVVLVLIQESGSGLGDPLCSNAWKLLEWVFTMNEDCWLLCLSSSLSSLLDLVNKGSLECLDQEPICRVRKLLSNPSISKTVFFCLLSLAPAHQAKPGASNVLPVFSKFHENQPGVFVAAACEVLSMNHVESSIVALDILSAVRSSLQSMGRSRHEVLETTSEHLIYILLHDRSIRMRRMVLEIIEENGFLNRGVIRAIVTKLRDVDKKIREHAARLLATFSVQQLAEDVRPEDWQMIAAIALETGPEHSELRTHMKVILGNLLSSAELDASPSARLARLCGHSRDFSTALSILNLVPGSSFLLDEELRLRGQDHLLQHDEE